MTASSDPAAGLRLADLVAAFSLGTDLGLGQPMEHVLRSWLVASRLGELVGLDDDEQASLFYVALLAWVGCVADTPEVNRWYGDDIAYRGDTYASDLVGLPMLWFMVRHVGAGSRPLQRARVAAELVASGAAAAEHGLIAHCRATGMFAERVGLGTPVRDALQQAFTRWDGKGVPQGVAGEQIARPVRVVHLADVVVVFHRVRGVDAAVEVARKRRGTQFDPGLVDAFCAAAPEVLAAVDTVRDWTSVIDGEPALQRRLGDAELDAALEAVADFTDLRSPARAGHSRGVADLAADAARHVGLPEAEARTLRRAGLVHDIGLHGVPGTVLDKPGPLTAGEIERVRMHAYYTDRMLARPAALARLGAIAGLAHERIDGSGYHRGLPGAALSPAARILAAADTYHAMVEPRPYRPARDPDEAAAELRADAEAGRLAHDAVDAVLSAAGHRRSKRRPGPAGLTPRELEVLCLIARGSSNRQVAHALGITAKTAGTHVERIYTKIGASTRSTATLYALQHGLLDAAAPVVP